MSGWVGAWVYLPSAAPEKRKPPQMARERTSSLWPRRVRRQEKDSLRRWVGGWVSFHLEGGGEGGSWIEVLGSMGGWETRTMSHTLTVPSREPLMTTPASTPATKVRTEP